jgi:hypothetical protein
MQNNKIYCHISLKILNEIFGQNELLFKGPNFDLNSIFHQAILKVKQNLSLKLNIAVTGEHDI